jgi:RNA polymerase sigma-70 factor (ECF subfamily)
LLLKVRNPQNREAWQEFSALYRPLAYRLARRRGLQHADAEDLAQRVMLSLSDAIKTWTKDAERGTFRAWLARIARNAITNALTRRPMDAAFGGSSVIEQLNSVECGADSISNVIEEEHRRAVLRLAAERIRHEFQESTWLAFWLTSVEGQSIEQAAQEIRKSAGVVYAARSRIMRRLQIAVRELDLDLDGGS